jgi:D-sedoheptulose 7-phosphate isomerase
MNLDRRGSADLSRRVAPSDGHRENGAEHVAALVTGLAGFGAGVELAERWGRRLAEVLAGGGRLLAAGNGGSAAEAQHLTAELVGRYQDERRPYSALALHADTSSLTAITNDYGADQAYARQVVAHARPGDVLVLLSTSGGSRNVLAAARAGTSVGATVWAMTGPAPNPLADLADEALCADARTTATIQELHLVAIHVLCASLDRAASSPAVAIAGVPGEGQVVGGLAGGRP